jgi:hypothetical protein
VLIVAAASQKPRSEKEAMFAKLTFLIVSLGIVGCSLLALRQQRLQAASEMAQAQLRIRESDERLYELRSAVAARITPQEIEKLASVAGPLRPATNDIPGTLTTNELLGMDAQGNITAIEPEETQPQNKPATKPAKAKPSDAAGKKKSEPAKTKPGSTTRPSRLAGRNE